MHGGLTESQKDSNSEYETQSIVVDVTTSSSDSQINANLAHIEHNIQNDTFDTDQNTELNDQSEVEHTLTNLFNITTILDDNE